MVLELRKIMEMIRERKIIGLERDQQRERKWYKGYCKWCGEDLGFFALPRLCWPCDKVKIELDVYKLRKIYSIRN